ncbi:hypothetical protein IAU59_005646 [Kwoniella sp. CBS 9459]
MSSKETSITKTETIPHVPPSNKRPRKSQEGPNQRGVDPPRDSLALLKRLQKAVEHEKAASQTLKREKEDLQAENEVLRAESEKNRNDIADLQTQNGRLVEKTETYVEKQRDYDQVNKAREKERDLATERLDQVNAEWTAKLSAKDEENQALALDVETAKEDKKKLEDDVASTKQELAEASALLQKIQFLRDARQKRIQEDAQRGIEIDQELDSWMIKDEPTSHSHAPDSRPRKVLPRTSKMNKR